MTTAIKRFTYRAPNGKVLQNLSGPIEPIDVDALRREYDEWFEENKRILAGYSVEQFLEEKRRDVERGLA